MSTRLDRLFLLLDSGSTPIIRKSAAEQLGEVQKLHPHELHNLLTKVHLYLRSASWETRIAAGHAVQAVARNVPQWCPKLAVKSEEPGGFSLTGGRLQLSQFDIQRVLLCGESLLASEGAEFDVEEDIGLEEKDKLVQQKHLLNKKLGLDGAGGLGLHGEELFKEEDLVVRREINSFPTQPQSCVQDILKQQLNSQSFLSSRELNRAKRKAKLLAKQVSRDSEQKNGDSEGEPSCKIRKTSSFVVEQPDEDKIMLDTIPDNTLNMEEMDEWPFETFSEALMNDLFHATWERRHGAATGLRELVKSHGAGAGKLADLSLEQIEDLHQLWLQDIAVRLVCVLALDRFGDFVSDEVVAPVRETCAQTLGVVLHHMQAGSVRGLTGVLVQLLVQEQWEVRHGGLLGIKYLMAVRKDLTCSLLPALLPVVFRGLQDEEDDVRTVAAASLIPITDTLVETQPHQVAPIVTCLWHTLLDLDDLSASTHSIMTLLASLLAHPGVANTTQQSLTELVPRIWPFLRHNIPSVRQASLVTLKTLLERQKNEEGLAVWILPILQDALRHVLQRALLETNAENLDLVYEVWKQILATSSLVHLVAASCPWLSVWWCLCMQPAMLPFDTSLLIEAKHNPKTLTPTRVRQAAESQQHNKDQRDYIGGSTSLSESVAVRDAIVVRARTATTRLLGDLCCYLTKPHVELPSDLESPHVLLNRLFLYHLSSKSALQRIVCSHIITQWASIQHPCLCSQEVMSKLLECLQEAIYFDEIALGFTRLQAECREFISGLKQQNIDMDAVFSPGSVLTLEQAEALCTTVFDSAVNNIVQHQRQVFKDRCRQLHNSVQQTSQEQQVLNNRVHCSLAGAVISLQNLPDKMNPVVRPLMDVLKREQNVQLQGDAGSSLSGLIKQCVGRTPCPNGKILKNLCTMLCSDPGFTPVIGQESSTATAVDLSKEASCDKYSGILTLCAQQVSVTSGRGRKGPVLKKPQGLSVRVSMESIIAEEDDTKRQLLIQRRGATLTLITITKDAGNQLMEQVPSIWQSVSELLVRFENKDLSKLMDNDGETQELVNSLQLLEVVALSFHSSLHQKLLEKVSAICTCVKHPYTAARHMAARVIAIFCQLATQVVMNRVIEDIVPLLGASVTCRQGAIEAISCILDQLGLSVIAYIVLLVVPVLGCMSDQNEAVRLMATSCFATLIRLLPLEAGIPDPPQMSESLIKKKEHERRFLEQLLDGSKIDAYKLPIPIHAELRKYQQDGVNWLWFLNKYKLHGILCDDMGLGKTLQSICILAGDHFFRQEKFEESSQPDCAPLPSIVICPPTLTGHWVFEVEKFVSKDYLNPLHYTGTPIERQKLQRKIKKHNMVVASYDVVRNDIDYFGSIKWNYCILDEGHIIKNSKTKLSRAVKQLTCNHRLILSGTPIQNNVLELWSLFDFLMPGFLGTEKQFQTRYGRPILQSRDAKSSSKEQEAGVLAMESLHRQVLPFLLRRLKEDVLQDLPPKIIQDYYCDLSPLQVRLYEDFAKSRAKKSVEDSIGEPESPDKSSSADGTSHIFQALQYLKKVCNHPALVMNPQHPQYSIVTAELKQQNSSLMDIQHAPKLSALRQLLMDCGIGATAAESLDMPVVNLHRVLLFCQLKSMLDIVEKDLLRSLMPSVTYLRLDGTVPAGNRMSIVNRFNNDPSIDVLLLTTHVGGLGLNLTGADTVIFVEHDWNPMKDLQAMDRAHRIGQKKVVNVYRLISRGTLEEKIMGLQKFKINIANTVISRENSSLASMGTDQLLDLFTLDNATKTKPASRTEINMEKSGGMKSILDNMEELWDEKQYETEYDLSNFMNTLNK